MEKSGLACTSCKGILCSASSEAFQSGEVTVILKLATFSILAGALSAGSVVHASQATVQDSSIAELEQQIAALQAKIEEKKLLAEALAAIQAERLAIEKADKARALLASKSKVVVPVAPSTAPKALSGAPAEFAQPQSSAATPSSVTTITAEPGKPVVTEVVRFPIAASDPKPSSVTTQSTKPDGAVVTEQTRWSQQALAENESGKTKFGGLEFGIGIAFSTDLGKRGRIGSAEVVNGVVRVMDSENTRARLLLESHYFFTPTNARGGYAERLGVRNYPDDIDPLTGQVRERGVKNWGVGPFIALQAGEGELIQAVGAGVMFGFRRPGDGSGSFNLGLGILHDMNVRTLGEGIIENEPLPVGETAVRYKERSQAGLMILSSYSF